jgi:hypothetical protein
MNHWFPDYHQVLQFRLFGITMLLGMVAVCGTLGRGLRIGYRVLASHVQRGLPIWQRRSP